MKKTNLKSIAFFNDYGGDTRHPCVKKSTLYKIAHSNQWKIEKSNKNSLQITLPDGVQHTLNNGFRFHYNSLKPIALQSLLLKGFTL